MDALNKKKTLLILGIVLLVILSITLTILNLAKQPQSIKDDFLNQKGEKTTKNFVSRLLNKIQGKSETQPKDEETTTDIAKTFQQKLKTINSDEITQKLNRLNKKNLATARENLYWTLSYKEFIKVYENNYAIYPFAVFCDQSGCKPQPHDKQLSIPILLSSVYVYKNTGDPILKNSIEKDMQFLKGQTFQPNFLHCYFIEKIIHTKLFNQQEQTLKDFCKNSFRLRGPEVANYSQNLDVHNILAKEVFETINGQRFEVIKENLPLPKNEDEFLTYASYVPDKISEYKLFNTISSIQEAKGYLDMAVYYLNQNPTLTNQIKGIPLLALGSFKLEEVTRNVEYNKLGYLLLEKSLKSRDNLEKITHVLLLEDYLYERTQDQLYKDDISALLKYVKENFQAEHGFARIKTDSRKMYFTLDNAILSYMLSKYQ